jgi:hypothetical protein
VFLNQSIILIEGRALIKHNAAPAACADIACTFASAAVALFLHQACVRAGCRLKHILLASLMRLFDVIWLY